jgi:amidohydrolase
MQKPKELILKKSAALNNELIRLRRHFHKLPELSFEEHKTASFICDYLEREGIPFRKGIAGTGIIGIIEGKKPGTRVVGLRADMDALPLTESNDVEYASSEPGIMHACGHDAHMAMLLGTAVLLNSIKDSFGGKILLIFQPAEELAPGGASLMINSGAFNNPKPDLVLAQHVLPELETGKVGYRAGRYMASSDEIYITVKGTGGHAALPGLTTDQIYIASQLIIRLKDRITREQSTNMIPTVLGIGKISGEGATNVIPGKVEIAGTIRTFDESWRSEIKNLITSICLETAEEYKVNISANIVKGYPVLINDKTLTEESISLSTELLGKDKVKLFDLRMSSEDFAFFTEAFPSVYLRVGIKKPGDKMRALHTPGFDIDEEGLQTGVANMSWLAINFLSDSQNQI